MKILFVNIVETTVFVNFAHPLHMPLLDVVGMRIGEIKQPLAEMQHHRVAAQLFLIVEALRKHFLFESAAYNGALIGKGQFFGLYKTAGLFEQSRASDFFHIKQHNAAVDIIGAHQHFAVTVARRGVLHSAYVRVVQKAYVAVKNKE